MGEPVFNDPWYPPEQLAKLRSLVHVAVRESEPGSFVEIGCWEGRSTLAIAQVIADEFPYPPTLHAVDTWLGNVEEGPNHPSVVGAHARDVLATFRSNLQDCRVVIHQTTGAAYLRQRSGIIAFIHLDASHTYRATKELIELALPLMAPGGVMCGDDFANAHAGREELDGGVERAVRECLPHFVEAGNLWWWQRHPHHRHGGSRVGSGSTGAD